MIYPLRQRFAQHSDEIFTARVTGKGNVIRSVGEYLVTCDRREEWAAVIRASQRQQPGYSSRSED